MTAELSHFIGGKHVKGTSGRFGDVYQPMDGTIRAKVPLASKVEVAAAVENAKAAQPAWAATNPQRRARVLMKFLELVARDNDKLADCLAREHGKTVADAKGDIQRGVEVIEFACGVPHLMKGEFTDNAGPGIDIYSMRQPLGVVAGITPFNFPAMIPMWKLGPAIACGNAFILKPSERDPGVPLMLAELMIEAGLPPGILNVVNGDKEAVDAILDHRDIQAVGFVGSTPIAEYIYARGCAAGKRVQCFGGAKNHMIVMPDADMDQAVDALMGAGYGSAGERCMAISVAVPVGAKTADLLVEKLIPRVESLKIGPSTSADADFGPMVTAAHLKKVKDYVDIGIKEGAKLKVDGRDFKMQGYENGFYMGGCLFDEVKPSMRIYKEEIFGPCCRWCAPRPTRKASSSPTTTSTATASPSSPATATRRAISPPRSTSAWSASTCRSRCRSPTTPSAAGSAQASATSTSTVPTAMRFYTKTKTVTSRWPSGHKEGAEFVIPTMK